MNEYRPGIFQYKVLAWTTIIFFGCGALFSMFRESEFYIFGFFLLFSAVGVYLLAIASKVKLNQDAIYVYSIFAKYRLFWHEIEYLERGTWVCVFHGKENKRLVVPIPWSGKQADSASEFLMKRLDALNVKENDGIFDGFFSDYKIHKNVRIKNA